jgi:hypothetical protein
VTEADDALLADLRASREGLLAAIAGVSEEQFKRRPPVEAVGSAGDWSIAETLAHLFAAEQRAGAQLEARLGTSPLGPLSVRRRGGDRAVALSEEERNEEARRGRGVPVPQIIHGLLAERRRLERVLAETDMRGARTELEGVVRRDVVDHEREHTAQIEAVKAALPKRSSPGNHA